MEEIYLFKWRITEKRVKQQYSTYTDVLYNIVYECSGELRQTDSITGVENIVTAGIDQMIDLPIDNIENFIPLVNVTDDIIFTWLENLGINKTTIENQLKIVLQAKL